MPNSVTIRTSAPGAKQAAADIGFLKKNITSVGGKGTGPLGSMLGGLGAIGAPALLAGAGIGLFTTKLAAGFKGMIDEEAQLGRLDTALRNNIKGWDGNTSSIDKLIDSSDDLGFSDDQVREAIIKLIPATKNLARAEEDVALAQDIMRGTGKSWEESVDLVSKAERGLGGALKKAGIAIGDANTAAELRNVLMETFAGQAEKYANTTAGKLEAANVKMDEGFEDLATSIKDAASSVGDFAAQGPQAADLIIDQLFGNKAHTQAAIQARVDYMGNRIIDQFQKTKAALVAAGDKAGQTLAYSSGEGFNKTIKDIRFGSTLTDSLADELRDGVKNDIKDAMDDVKWAIAHPLEQARQAAQIEGALTTLEYKRGLASNTPGVNAVIDQQIMVLRGKWSELTGIAYREGVDAANALESGLRTFNAPSFPVFGKKRRKKGEKAPAGENPGGGGRAAGGPVESGQTYLVGEDGPELLHMGRRGFVDNGRGNGGRGGGGMNIHISLSTREFSHHSAHFATIQRGGPSFS